VAFRSRGGRTGVPQCEMNPVDGARWESDKAGRSGRWSVPVVVHVDTPGTGPEISTFPSDAFIEELAKNRKGNAWLKDQEREI